MQKHYYAHMYIIIKEKLIFEATVKILKHQKDINTV